nr:MAG TPA: hypothetical protein [Caudoviricetes sp.]
MFLLYNVINLLLTNVLFCIFLSLTYFKFHYIINTG